MLEHVDHANTRQNRNFWEHHLERWKQSGLSQLAYCREHHLKPHRFYYWRRRILKPQTKVSFLPVKLPHGYPSAAAARIENHMPISGGDCMNKNKKNVAHSMSFHTASLCKGIGHVCAFRYICINDPGCGSAKS